MDYNYINIADRINLNIISTTDGDTWTNRSGTVTPGLYVNDVTPAVYNISSTTIRFYLYGGWNFKSDNKESIYCSIHLNDLSLSSYGPKSIYCASVYLPNGTTLFAGGCTAALNTKG